VPLSVAIPELVGGLVYLALGGDFLVRGALALARTTRISPMIVGLTVVALGTSAPELIVCLQAALTGYPEIAIANVVGSNIANVLLVIALPALIYPLAGNQSSARSDALLMMFVSVGFVGLCLDGHIGRVDGLVLLGGLGVFAAIQLRAGRAAAEPPPRPGALTIVPGLPSEGRWIALLLVAGAVCLPFGANLLVHGAIGLADRFNVPTEVVGLTVIAASTSMPELVTTLIATLRRAPDVALGNVMGSNVLNILLIMGATALVGREAIAVPPGFLAYDLPLMLVAALILTGVTLRRASVGRKLGIAMLLTYAAYAYLLYAGVAA